MKNFLKRCIALILVLLFLTMTVGCSGGSGNGDEDNEKPTVQTKNVLSDPDFSTGFVMHGTGYDEDGNVNPAEREVKKVIKFGEKEPAWKIAQWYSRNRLHDGEETIDDSTYTIADTSKSIVLDRNTGSITLSLNAGEEFDGVQTSVGAFWPHLLIEQTVDPVRFADCNTLEASLSFRLNRSLDHAADFGAVKPNFQAQFAWFIYVVNSNQDSEGFGEFLWFGFNLYDPTKLYAQQVAMQDFAGGNPGNYIFAMGASDCIGTERVRVGKQVDMKVDLFEAVQKGLDVAHKAGFMTKTTLQDCSVTGMNIGFEIFDVWDLSATIFDIGINYTEKAEG